MLSQVQPLTVHTLRTVRYESSKMSEVVASVRQEKLTGSVTLHFNEGRLMTVDWTDGKKTLDAKGELCSKLD